MSPENPSTNDNSSNPSALTPTFPTSPNVSVQMPAKQFKRSYKACLNCRTRKIKCDLGPPNNPMNPPCARCRRERKECIFAESRRGTSTRKKKEERGLKGIPEPRISKAAEKPPIADFTNPTIEQQKDLIESYGKLSPRNNTAEVSTMQGALLFLANAAGTIAKADERDRLIAGKHRTDGVVTGNSPPSPPRNKDTEANQNNPNRQLIPSTNLTDYSYIGEGKLISEPDAIELINFYFSFMHPFYPYIPPDLHDPKTLAGYPILLCSVLTIATRYKPPSGIVTNKDGTVSKGKEVDEALRIHDELWQHCQTLVSQSVWGEASTRSVGTVFSFLLFTEWNPRAIHWKFSDYANNVEVGRGKNNEDNLAGIGAMRRSSRMQWMLCGTSIRLAQDMGFMENSSRVFVATHLSETTIAMTIGQRSMLAQSLAEVNLVEDLNTTESAQQEEDFVLAGNEDELKKFNRSGTPLKFTFLQKANVELLKISSLAYETLYCGKSTDSTDQKQVLAILSILSPLLASWESKYKQLLTNDQESKVTQNILIMIKTNGTLNNEEKEILKNVIDTESLRFDYYYAQLYIFSLALFNDGSINSGNQAQSSQNKKHLRVDELYKAAKYIEIAFTAATEVIATATKIHKLKMLRFMPVRWVTRIVRSVAFVVKCYITSSNLKTDNYYKSTVMGLSMISTEGIIQKVQKAAIILRDASVDELHLCNRYSTILMYLCSEMRAGQATKLAHNQALLQKKINHNNNNSNNSHNNTNAATNNIPSNNSFSMPTQPLPSIPLHSSVNGKFNNVDNAPQPTNMSNYPSIYSNNNSTNYSIPTNYNSSSIYNSYSYPDQYNSDDYLAASGIQNVMMNFGLEFVEPLTEMLAQQMSGDPNSLNNFDNRAPSLSSVSTGALTPNENNQPHQ